MQNQEILHLPSTTSPTSELTSKARLPYACITGYATTQPRHYYPIELENLCLIIQRRSSLAVLNVLQLVGQPNRRKVKFSVSALREERLAAFLILQYADANTTERKQVQEAKTGINNSEPLFYNYKKDIDRLYAYI